MISNLRQHGNEFKSMILRDIYRVRHWRDGDIDTIFDFGANIGFFSVFMRMRHPNAKVIAIEAEREVCSYLRQNVNMLNIIVDERPLANGKPVYMKSRGHLLDAMFVPKEQERSYQVGSASLETFFQDYECKLTDSYLLKFNCEGGEKYLVGDAQAEQILASAKQVCLQFHCWDEATPFEDWLKREDYELWIKDTFEKTHWYKFYRYRAPVFNCIMKQK